MRWFKRIDYGAPFPLERMRRDMVDLLVLIVGLSAKLAIVNVVFLYTSVYKYVRSLLCSGD